MTIAAGFVCTDGIVMCADSQESLGDYKFPVEKLVIRGANNAELMMALAGAGHGPMIDMAISRIVRNIRNAAPQCYDDVEDVIGSTLLSLYDNEFKSCPVDDPSESIIELLVGLKYYKADHPILYKTYATTISEVAEHAVIGSGRAVQYQIHKLFRMHEPTSRVVPIAINLLSVAEVVLRSVGGESVLAVLHRGVSNGIGSVFGSEINILRKAQSELESAAGFLTLDLLDATKSDEELGESLAVFSDLAVNLRVRRMEEHRNLMSWLDAVTQALSGKKEATQSASQTSEDQPSPCDGEYSEKDQHGPGD